MDSIPNNTLVRYIGMVKDTLNPEYFVSEFQDPDGQWQSTRYGDAVDTQRIYENGDKKFDERQPILAIPVPGRTEWVTNLHDDLALSSALQTCSGEMHLRQKRVFTCSDEDGNKLAPDTAHEHPHTDMPQKRTTNPGQCSKARALSPLESQLRHIPQGSCVVHIYGEKNVKLNDVIEVYGILSRVPGMAQEGSEMDLDQDANASKIPTSIAPRLHGVVVKTLSSPVPGGMCRFDKSILGQAREVVKHSLLEVLGGDDLAAEYLLLQLISRVHSRPRETNQGALGIISLNITGIRDKRYCTSVRSILSDLMPCVMNLELSCAELNRSLWYPTRLADQSFLSDAILQLPNGCILLLDETAMSPGELSEIGLKNLSALQSIMQSQKLPYDFQFYQIDQVTDYPTVILSQGRTVLKGVGEMQLPLSQSAQANVTACSRLPSRDISMAREYLSSAKISEFSIPKELEEVLLRDMTVEMKKKGSGNVDEGSFHCWLNVRLFWHNFSVRFIVLT